MEQSKQSNQTKITIYKVRSIKYLDSTGQGSVLFITTSKNKADKFLVKYPDRFYITETLGNSLCD